MEEMRQKLATEKEDLLRERSRCALARLEAHAQEKAWAARRAEADEEAREGSEIHVLNDKIGWHVGRDVPIQSPSFGMSSGPVRA